MNKSCICFMCGKEFTKDNPKTNHHAIPVSLKPVSNLIIPIHKECHDKINNSVCYGNKDKDFKKLINILQNTLNSLNKRAKNTGAKK